MSYNIGDKFIIEIEKELYDDPYHGESLAPGKPLYKIKGFNALVFDSNGLDKLEKYEEPKPERGWEEVSDTIFGKGTRTRCMHCGESFWHYMRQFDFCPKCGHYNGRLL